MQNRFFLILFLCFFSSQSQAQISKNITFDSLVNSSLSLSEKSIYEANFKEAEKYVQVAHFEKFEAYQPKHQLALTIQNFRIKSFKNRVQNIKTEAKENLSQLIDLQPIAKIVLDKNILADYYSILAFAYFSNKENDLAFQYFDKALQLYIQTGNFYKIAQTRASIISLTQTIFQNNGNNDALESMIVAFEKEIEFAKNNNNQYALSFNTRHLAQIYLRQTKDYEKAKELFEQSLSLRENIGFKPYLPASYFSLGEVAEKMEKHQEAVNMFQKSYTIADEIGFVHYAYNARIKNAEIYQKRGNLNKAKEYYVDALKSASFNGYLEVIDEVLHKMEVLKDK